METRERELWEKRTELIRSDMTSMGIQKKREMERERSGEREKGGQSEREMGIKRYKNRQGSKGKPMIERKE